VIREYIEQEAFHQDRLRAWEKYQATGLHVTGDEVIAWLATWGEENETAAPLCHSKSIATHNLKTAIPANISALA
jgi:hypothetical protein